MKNFLIKFKSLLKKKPEQIQKTLNPHRNWIILLYILFVVIALLIIFSLYLLYQIKNDRVFQVAPVAKESNTSINEKLLKRVTDSFKDKAQKESELTTNPTYYRDPGL